MPKAAQNSIMPGRVTFMGGRGELPMIEVTTAWSTAEIYLHGAHVTNFKKNGEPPLLFLSQCSRFEAGAPIRGGVPVIFPWFGAREGMPMHGFARLHAWKVKEVIPAADGSVSVRLVLPDSAESATYPPFAAEYIVTVNEELTLDFVIENKSDREKFEFESCLHTYFEVGDIAATSIHGLNGVTYLDKVQNFAKKKEKEPAIHITSEVDRVYQSTTGPVEIRDEKFGRIIRVEKQSSASTVVWNPWIAKAQEMPDFCNDEYRNMVCVESGNVMDKKITLAPGKKSFLKVKLSSKQIK